MFFMASKENPRQKKFFRRITKDWLFLLQLLILLLLALHLMEPLTKYQHDITAENTIVVLDVSASSQVYEGRNTRFEKGIKFARDALSNQNTIILAKSSPKLLGTDMPYDDAIDMLNSLTPTTSPSGIGDAMILAGETLGSREGRIVVISDFINTEGMDPATAQSVLESKGQVVSMINTVEDDHPNVGIVNMEVDEQTVTVFIQNFNDKTETVSVVAGGFRKELILDPQSSDTVSFETPTENTKVEIAGADDDFPADDIAYIAAPKSQKVQVLLITNNESVFLRNALTTLHSVELEVATPPIVPSGRYDVYVIHDIEPGAVLPGTFEGIDKYVREGASLIITAQPDMDQINYRGLLPVTRGERGSRAFVFVEQLNTFTRDLEFGSVDGYWKMQDRNGAVTIASDGDNSSIISFAQHGSGKILYMGMEKQASDFKLSPSYPIFWVKLVQFLVGQESITNLNVRTGDSIILEAVKTINTPGGRVKQNALIFEYAGIYNFPDKDMAANLLDVDESMINPSDEVQEVALREVKLQPVKEEREFSFEIPIAIAVMILLLLELAYIKWRGDL